MFAGTVLPSNDKNAAAILYHDADVTLGDQMASAVVQGMVKSEMLDVSPAAALALQAKGIDFYADESKVVGLMVDYEIDDYDASRYKRLGAAVGKERGADFDNIKPFGGRKRCIVKDDGTITAWYGDSGFVEDGTAGQVMVYQPAFYYKVEPVRLNPIDTGIGNHIACANYYVSEKPAQGFKLHPAFYDEKGEVVPYILYGAYEGSLWIGAEQKYFNDSEASAAKQAEKEKEEAEAGDQSRVSSGAGGVQDAAKPAAQHAAIRRYFGEEEQVASAIAIEYTFDPSADKLCSVSGVKPISGLHMPMTKANLEAAAKLHGNGWHLNTIKAASANQLLIMIECGDMNVQNAIEWGVVDFDEPPADLVVNNSSRTGSTSELGNGTGQASMTIGDHIDGITEDTERGKLAVTYRGMENPWGNIFEDVNGINIWGDGTMAGGQPYVAEDFDFDENRNDGNYHTAGFTVPNHIHYIGYFGYGDPDYDWLFIPSEWGGSYQFPGDSMYVSPDNNNHFNSVRQSGCFYSSYDAGAFTTYMNYRHDSASNTTGGRLIYIPQKI